MTKETNKLFTVSVGIPAYNEEANIGKLIQSIFSQQQSNFALDNIIITSDQSTDNTDNIVKSFKSKKIILVRNKKRLGQALSQNVIVSKNKSDILVLLNADIKLGSKLFISQIIKPFYENEKVGLVGAKVVPLKGLTLLEKILNHSTHMKQEIAEVFNGSDNIFLCHGRARAFSIKFTKSFNWSAIAGEDAYSYLQCKLHQFNFVFSPNSVVYYRSPQTLRDHFKQSIRYFNGRLALEEHFSHIVVFRNFSPPKSIIFVKMIKYFILNPFYFMGYILLLVYSKTRSLSTNMAIGAWDMSMSSKKL